MKNLKFFFLGAITLMMAAAFTSCGDDEDGDDAEGRCLKGTWVCYDNVENEQETAVFKGDGSGYFENIRLDDGDKETDYFDDYKVADGTLWIKWEDSSRFEDEGKITVSKKSFTLTDGDDVMVFHKK